LSRAGLTDFLAEHDIFPNGRHDDQVDTTTQAIKRLTQSGPAMLGFLKMLAEEKATQTEAVVPLVTYGYGPDWQPPQPAKRTD